MKESLEKSMDESKSASMFEDILYDRATHRTIDRPHTSLYRQEYVELLCDISPEHQKNILDNINLLSHMNGHRGAMLRTAVTSRSISPEGKYLHDLFQWSGKLIEHTGSPDFEPLLEAPPIRTPDAETTYEHIVFLEKNPATDRQGIDRARISEIAALLNMSPETSKWIDIVAPLTEALENPEFTERLLSTIGSIPTEIYTKKVFKNIPSDRVVTILECLRKVDGADYERAKLLNYFITSKHANAFRIRGKTHITLDTNGLFINIGALHSHVPYGLCLPETIAALQHDRWLSENEIVELHIRSADENSDRQTVAHERERQEQAFRLAYEPALEMPIEEALVQKPEMIVSACLRGAILPDTLIDHICDSASPEMRFALMELAEKMTEGITNVVTNRANKREHPTYKTLHTAEDTYEVRNSILNSPEYYNVVKIALRLLQNPLPYNHGQSGYIRGAFKVQNGEQHVFFEMLHEGRSARILLNESKHLHVKEKRHLDEIPLYGRDEYVAAERTIATFDRFVQSSKSIRTITILDSATMIDVETCVDFILSSVTSLYPQAREHFHALKDSPAISQQDHLMALARICDEAAAQYKSFLYTNLLRDPSLFHEQITPEVKKRDLHFGSATFEDMREHVAPHGCNEDLSTTSQPIRIVTLHYKPKDLTGTIPFHIEESAIQALRLNPNRPLINVIGGCKNLDRRLDQDPLELMSRAIVEVAHEYKANVAVPGTQSGIGVEFGKANIDYRTHFGHLPHDDQTHLFAISPGENTYFPNSPFFNIHTDKNDMFAITPVDSILTPFGADWNATGVRKLQSPYVHHIAYMESLFQHIAARQKKIIVVGNGGFYSLLELNDSFRRGFNVVLINDSGRFAEIASHLIQHPRVLSEFARGSEGDNDLSKLIRDSMPSTTVDEFFKKDFGFESAAETEDYQIYRDALRIFTRIVQNNTEHVSTTSLRTLPSTLREQLQK